MKTSTTTESKKILKHAKKIYLEGVTDFGASVIGGLVINFSNAKSIKDKVLSVEDVVLLIDKLVTEYKSK